MGTFCRICFKQMFNIKSISLQSDNFLKHQLMFCLPEMDLRALSDPKLCNSCVGTLYMIYKFKIKCRKVEDKINNYQMDADERLTIIEEVGLNDSSRVVCRACLVDHTGGYFPFAARMPLYKDKLMLCVPEMDLQTIPDINLCKDCHTALYTFYYFKLNFLDMERSIKDYLESDCVVDCKDLPVLSSVFLKRKISDHPEDFAIKRKEIDLARGSQAKVMKMYSRPHPIGKLFKCSQCGYITARKCLFDVHNCFRASEKPFECFQCGFEYAKYSFEQHIFVHGKKPFKCPQCQYSTSDELSLKRHIREHFAEKRKCLYCEYTTAQKFKSEKFIHDRANAKQVKDEYIVVYKSGLIKRVRISADPIKVKCPQCEYSTIRRDKLDEHIRAHMIEKLFSHPLDP